MVLGNAVHFKGLDLITLGQAYQGTQPALVVYQGKVTWAKRIVGSYRYPDRILLNTTAQNTLTNLLESQMEKSSILINPFS